MAAGTLPDIAYPRYSPSGDRIAFVATNTSSSEPHLGLATEVVFTRGRLWNVRVVQRDGTGLRQLAAVGADDASIAWSPDGSQLIVYGSTGARLIDAVSWLPKTAKRPR